MEVIGASTKKLELDSAGKAVLQASRTELYMDMRFFGGALNSLLYEMDLSTTTVGTDAVSIRFNPSYILRLYVEEPGKLNRTYIHMLLHCIFRHMYTSARYEDVRLFDLCADIVVESLLDTMDYQSIYRVSSDFRDRWVKELESALKTLTVEKLYRYFSEERELEELEYEKLEREFKLDDHGFWQRLSDNPADEDQSNEDKDKEMPPLDDDMTPPDSGNDSEDNGKKKEKYINPRRLKQIQNKEKDWDKEAKRLQTEIETIGSKASDKLGKLRWTLKFFNTSRTDYRKFLERFKVLKEEGGIDLDSFDYGMYSFGIEHYGNMPLIEENEFREVKKVQELVIAIDTSASCKDELVQVFLNETARILLTGDSFFQRIKIHVIECDNQIQRDELITEVADMKKYADGIHVEGGYGTDFRPVFEYVDKLKAEGAFENLKGLIYFTDGYGTYPEKVTTYDTAFVFPENGEYEDENVPDWAIKLYV
ncbi:VWA-like domain-containing protein [Butyrivibrio proteoclasticus]|uniref:vWA domain-containing protein n=1 Tax=Butyrivibrio proteoclasticus TaxID=43305 RepID=UPI00047BA718|nr:VWA-like domain-containing protein [Butyrivibrio proteoclasticus]